MLIAGDEVRAIINLHVAIMHAWHTRIHIASFIWTSTKNEWNAQNPI